MYLIRYTDKRNNSLIQQSFSTIEGPEVILTVPAIVGHRNLMLLRLTCPSSEKKIDFRKSANEDTVQCTGNITEQDNN